MRSGEVADMMGIDSQTILNWTREPDVAGFFSEAARGEGVKQRIYNEDDVLILNTIHHLSSDLRDGKKIDWEAISGQLGIGYRYNVMPNNTLTRDPRSVPMDMVKSFTVGELAKKDAELARIAGERDAALQMVDYLKGQLNDERVEHKSELDKVRLENKELNDEINKAGREAAMWQARYEMLKEQDNKNNV